MNNANMKRYAPAVVRIGMALVYLWFGYSQVTDPMGWTVWLPPEAAMLPFAPATLIMANGIFEIVASLCLLFSFYIRPAALLLALHLVGIMANVGYNDVSVRDFGLMMATLGVFLQGKDECPFVACFKKLAGK